MGFRDFYNKDYNYFLNEQLQIHHPFHAPRYAMQRLRAYANMFNRDMRKILINDNSLCKICGSSKKLQLDHILPISNGGENKIENLQILCSKCNRKKSDN